MIAGFHNVSEEDIKLFYENLDNQVMIKRAQAIVKQRAAARAARIVGGQKVERGQHGNLLHLPMANIDSTYYFTRMNQEREANAARMATDENVWADPDFLKYELRNNPELRPVLNDTNAPMHMNGLIMPTTENFKAAKANRAKAR